MSHRRLTTSATPEATNIDTIETFDVYTCDNCGDHIAKDRITFVSGSIILPGGKNWPLNGHLDEKCIDILAALIPDVFKNASTT